MATGESGIPFYDFNIQLKINKDAWADYTLGHPTNIGVAATPTYWFFASLQSFGIPDFLLQAFFFWLVLVISGISIFLLSKELFNKLDSKFLILAVFFYWFNPFALVNIWNRFLNNYFVFYAFVPLALLLFIKGIRLQRYIYSILIGLLSAIFSYSQTSMALNVIFWLVLFYTAIFYIFVENSWINRFFIIKFFILTFIFWFVVNSWWINQVFNYISSGSFDAVSTGSFTAIGNYQTFANLSAILGNISDLIRLRHDYFFNNPDISWIKIYNSPIFTLFNFFMAMLISIPIIFIKNRAVLFTGGLFLIGIFLTKGNNPPFGEINDSVFLFSPLMQLFRNPFEKFGFILALSSTLLFIQGSKSICDLLKNKARELFYFSVVIIITLVWGISFWTGSVFIGAERPINDSKIGYQVKVPEHYKQASEWLRSQNDDFRLIVLPIGGEGITYKWEKGYSGVELTNQLLPKTAISFSTNIPFYDDVSKNIERLFLTTNLLPSLSNALNTKYILYRPDIDWEVRKMRDPKVVLSKLEEKQQKGELTKVAQFGDLIFFQITSKDKEEIYTANTTFLSYSKPNISDLEFSQSNLVISTGNKIDKIPKNKIEGEVIHPKAQFFLDYKKEPVFEIRQDIFPHVAILPKQISYPFVVIKDRLKEETIKDREELLEYRLVILGKRLVEAKFSADLNDEGGIRIAIVHYHTLLDRTIRLLEQLYMIDQGNKQASLQGKLYLIFSRHVKVLEDLQNRFGQTSKTGVEVESTLKLLKTSLIRAHIYPAYGFLEDLEFPLKRRMIYHFEVKKSGEYELLWDEKILNGYYKISSGDQIVLQVDDELSKMNLKTDGKGHVSLGKVYFEEGSHEIGLNLPEEINLIEVPLSMNFKVDHGSKVDYFPIKNYDSYSSYNINFDYWIKKGNGVQILVYDKKPEDIISTTKPRKESVVGPDLYDYTPKNYFGLFKLSEGAEEATIALEVIPWNDCETIFYSNRRERCKTEDFRRPYDKTTDVDISKLSVTRSFSDLPVLVKKDLVDKSLSPQHKFKKLDTTTYQIEIKEVKKPFFLVFSELFDPGWRLMDTDGKILNYQHFLANGYANGWYIDRMGNFQIILKFTPQDLLKLGEKISFVGVSFGLIFVAYEIWWRKNA